MAPGPCSQTTVVKSPSKQPFFFVWRRFMHTTCNAIWLLHLPSAALRVAFDHPNYSSLTTISVTRPQRPTVMACAHQARKDIMLHYDNSVCIPFTSHASPLPEPRPSTSLSRVTGLHTTPDEPYEASTPTTPRYKILVSSTRDVI